MSDETKQKTRLQTGQSGHLKRRIVAITSKNFETKKGNRASVSPRAGEGKHYRPFSGLDAITLADQNQEAIAP